MKRSRSFVRGLLGVLLAAASLLAALVPMIAPVVAAPNAAAAPGNMVISEFRFRGTGGEADEFIELFNRSCSATIDLQGWTLRFSNAATNDVLHQFPSGSAIPLAPGRYYLLASTASSSAGSADATYSGGVPSATGGVALFDSGNTLMDEVGVSSDGYHEGAELTPLTTDTDQGYVRQTPTSGSTNNMVVDTNKNAQDFVLQAPSQPQNTGDTGTCGIPTQTISGNTGVGGVTLSYSDITAQTVTSNGSGDYSLTVNSNWSGTVSPSLTGYVFTPPSRSYSHVLTDKNNQDYAASNATATRTLAPSSTPAPGYLSVVINEVAWPGTKASADDQWIELFNTRSYAINLTNWTLTGEGNTIGTSGVLTFTRAGSPDGDTVPTIPANGFFVIAKSRTIFRNLTPDYIDPNLNLVQCADCGEELRLRDKNSVLIDTANQSSSQWVAGDRTEYRTMERSGPSGPVADSRTAWLTFEGSPNPRIFDKANNLVLGTPGHRNWSTTVTPTPSITPTPFRFRTSTPLPPTPFAHMVINEFLPRAGTDWNQDGSIDVFDEFIEVKNLGPIDVDLRGWTLDDELDSGSAPFPLPSTKLKPGERAVFYGNTTHIKLEDSGDLVRLINTRQVVIDARGYGPVQNPDESHCRIPDGYYWRFPCFPTPGLENTLTGSAPIPPPNVESKPPPCLLADIIPTPFRDAECYGFGSGIYNPKYWDDQAGFKEFPVKDGIIKDRQTVK